MRRRGSYADECERQAAHYDCCRVCMDFVAFREAAVGCAGDPHRRPSAHELHGHPSFAHRGGAALARPSADVTGWEDARISPRSRIATP
jgi:hypothetical protein